MQLIPPESPPSRPLRFLRLSLTAALLAVFLWSCANSVDKLVSAKITHTSSSDEDMADWPVITACVLGSVNRSALVSPEGIQGKVPSREQIVAKVTYIRKSLQKRTSFESSHWQRHVRVAKAYNSEDFDVLTCYSFNLGKKLEPMDEVQLDMVTQESGSNSSNSVEASQFMQTLHEDGQFLYSLTDIAGMRSVRGASFRNPTSGNAFQFDMTAVAMISNRKNDCDRNNEQRLTQCVEDYVEKQVGCCMPWSLTRQNNNNKTPATCRPCSKMADLDLHGEIMKSLQLSAIEQIVNITGCRRNCRYNNFNVAYLSSYNTGVFSTTMISNQVGTPVSTEVYMYDVDDFVADVGGYLGLLVVASVLSVFDFVTDLVRAVASKINTMK